jgi:cytosine/uracil/thiamine/allantoin permease
MAAFLGLFALDAFDGRPFAEALPAFLIHLAPSFLVLAVVAASWKFEWIGAVAFVALAVLYAVMVRGRMDWIAAISGPLLIVAALFLVSWMRRAELHAAG